MTLSTKKINLKYMYTHTLIFKYNTEHVIYY